MSGTTNTRRTQYLEGTVSQLFGRFVFSPKESGRRGNGDEHLFVSESELHFDVNARTVNGDIVPSKDLNNLVSVLEKRERLERLGFTHGLKTRHAKR